MSESSDHIGGSAAARRRRERGEAARLRQLGGVLSPIILEARPRHDAGQGQGEAGSRTSAPPTLAPSLPKEKGRARRRPGAAAHDLWTKAQISAQSAKALFERGDTDGAVNRAYYAVFGAARAALANFRAALARSKGHGTIFRRFGKHLVEERGFDRSLGRGFLSRQGHARWVADYGEGPVDEATAHTVIGEMDRFLAAVEPLLKRPKR